MIAYIGAGFLAFGLLVTVVAAPFSLALVGFMVLCGFIAAISIVLAVLGLQSKPARQAASMEDGEDWEFEIL